MRFCFSILLCLAAFLTLGQSAMQQTEKQPDTPVVQQLPGAWRLVSVETIRQNNEVTYPFYGKHPEGLLIYDRSGWMSVQIASDPKPVVPNSGSREGVLAATPQEKATAFDGYYAYFGRWIVDPSGASVTHHITQSLYPGEWGQNAVRELSINGNRLTLVSNVHEMGADHKRRLVWERTQATP